MQPAVSVLIPAFNAADFISAALESALAQTLRDIEIIVVDDGSTDRTIATVEAFVRRDSRLCLRRHRNNRGAAAARNTGLASARGEWIALLDADDRYAPERLECLVDAATRFGADLIADNVLLTSFPERMPLEVGISPLVKLFDGPVRLPEFLDADTPGNGRFSLGYLKPLIRRGFLERHRIAYREHIKVSHDFALYVECLLKGAVYRLVPEAYYFYSIRADSLSNMPDVDTTRESAALNREFLSHPIVATHPELAAAFAARQGRTEARIAYGAWVKEIKERRFGQAGQMLLAHWPLTGLFLGGLLRSTGRRLLRRPYRLRGMRPVGR